MTINTMPNTAKQEAIRKAYGEYWERLFKYQQKEIIENDGRFYEYNDVKKINDPIFWEIKKNIDCVYDFDNDSLIPSSIENICDNNGWIRIESAKDFPEPGQYWVIDDDGDMFITDMEFFEDMFDWTAIRYYQPIIKPEKPIY